MIVGLNPSSSGPALLRVNADGTSTPLSIPAAAYEVRFIDSDHAGGVLVSTSTQVFRVTPAGVVTKVAGGDNHPIPVGTPAADYRFAEIDFAVSAPDGGFYIVTWGAGWNGSVIWSIDASGIITSYRDAPFNRRIVAAGADDSGLYLAAPSAPYDNINGARQVFRVVPATGHATLVAGSLRSAYVPDGGSALDAVIPNGDGESIDAAGNIYLPISADGIVARIDASGVITRFAGGGAGTSDGGLATDAALTEPCATTSDRSGNVFIADRSITAYSRIYRVDPSGRISRYAGRTSANPPATDPPRLRTSLRSPCRLVIDGNGRLIILDGTRRTDFNNMYKGVSARRVEADGAMTTLYSDDEATRVPRRLHRSVRLDGIQRRSGQHQAGSRGIVACRSGLLRSLVRPHSRRIRRCRQGVHVLRIRPHQDPAHGQGRRTHHEH